MDCLISIVPRTNLKLALTLTLTRTGANHQQLYKTLEPSCGTRITQMSHWKAARDSTVTHVNVSQQSHVCQFFHNHNPKNKKRLFIWIFTKRGKKANMPAGTALFGSATAGPGSTGGNKHLIEVRAGKMNLRGRMVYPDKRKGLLYVYQSEDSLMHFCWQDRTTGMNRVFIHLDVLWQQGHYHYTFP
ncbi:unnamed protein product [Acanthoscelides obtectus]|uniref:Pru domain-containing protein n=1 Tax=Acanthoscelides obtectus TaxID=200917 RepID=A0A9P0KIF1_ACAOB|nr:unnamed protein product [Acanthoscelides obtectus]CAK1656513.1 Proteasomal ubiquitin receptor ADRM1 [Acanthoscelides obtectus]